MLDAWLDLVHGGRCLGCGRPGRPLCAPCEHTLPCQPVPVRPTPCPPGLVEARAVAAYDGVVRTLLLAHKERGAIALAGPLGRLLAAAVPPSERPLALVPVPSRAATVRARGHDPMLRIARAAAARLRAAGRPAGVHRLLRQRLPVADQSGLDAAGRAANLADSMTVAGGARAALVRTMRAAEVLLCDDVLTTGATAREAQRALEDAGIGVAGLCCVAATRRRHAVPLPFSHTAH